MENAHNAQSPLVEKFKDVFEILGKDESYFTAKLVKECELRLNLEEKKVEKSLLEKRIRNAHERLSQVEELRILLRQFEAIIELMQKNIVRLLNVSTDC
jgi:hypothetical protein